MKISQLLPLILVAGVDGRLNHKHKNKRTKSFVNAIRSNLNKGSSSGALDVLPLEVGECTVSGGCMSSTKYITLDQNWRWLYHDDLYTPCYQDGYTCSGNDCSDCTLQKVSEAITDDGAYVGYDAYGITTSGSKLTMQYEAPNKGIGTRVYLMDGDTENSKYTMPSLLGKEISFTTEVSTLGCGFNGAMYLVEMAADGGKSSGAQGPFYGTGYCDAQCPGDLHTTETGEVNTGNQALCCNEMDLWEANAMANALTPHPCKTDGPFTLSDGSTAKEVCDSPGCDFNPYRNGATTFYGEEMTVDTAQPLTVVTQFIADDSTGKLAEIRRKYVQNSVVIDNAVITMGGEKYNSITDDYCTAETLAFDGASSSSFSENGGLTAMGESLERGMAMVFSLWNDPSAHMLWLDGTTTGTDGTGAGLVRGPCGSTDNSEDSSYLEKAYTTFSDVKIGELGSTFDADVTPAPVAPTTPTTPQPTPQPQPTCVSGAGTHCAYGGMETACCSGGMVCCDNGGAPGQWASCQDESYCTSSACEKDGSRTESCTVVNV